MKNNKLLISSIICLIISVFCGIGYLFLRNDTTNTIKSVSDLKNYTGIVYVGTDKCPDCRKFEEILDKVTKENKNFKYKKIEMLEIKKEENPKNIIEIINHIGVGNSIPIFVYVEKGEVVRILEFSDFDILPKDNKELALKIFFEKSLKKD